ncbi:MAG: DUF2442 domain-containing protein [Gemmatimonadota bacterium]
MARTAEPSEVGLEDLNQAAILRAQEADRVEPRAESATYDPKQDLVLVILRGGFAFGFPPRAVEGLQGATAQELSQLRISPSGDGLHWDGLDVDVSLKGLIMGALNLREWAPRIMGQTRSEAKARAARKNGRKGGRPRSRARPSS